MKEIDTKEQTEEVTNKMMTKIKTEDQERETMTMMRMIMKEMMTEMKEDILKTKIMRMTKDSQENAETRDTLKMMKRTKRILTIPTIQKLIQTKLNHMSMRLTILTDQTSQLRQTTPSSMKLNLLYSQVLRLYFQSMTYLLVSTRLTFLSLKLLLLSLSS
jgi:hypothetical protein